MGLSMVRRMRQSPCYECLGRGELRDPVVAHKVGPNRGFDPRQTDQRLDVSRIEHQGAVEKRLRLRDVFLGCPVVRPSPALEIQVHRIGIGRKLRSPRLNLDELGIEHVCQPRHDFVLHIEQVGDRFLKAFGPKVVAGFGIDQLGVHTKPVAATLHRAFQHVTDVQLAADLFEISCFISVCKGRVTADHE